VQRPTPLNERIEQHYTRPEIGDAILGALAATGKDVTSLEPDDLAPIDEFHIRGREATLELAHAAGIDASRYVLDVGSGIGGSSRCLAQAFGCRVVGIDLTAEYCRVATMLAERTGLSPRVTYRQGDALDLPFPDATFDIVWSQHASMNIPDKAGLYQEMHRVLKPGGALAIHDILAGPVSPLRFPVPWARVPETNFLVTPDELRILLEARGFRIVSWDDTTTQALEWFTMVAENVRRNGPPVLGFHLIFGPDVQRMGENQVRNLQEDRIVLAQIVARK